MASAATKPGTKLKELLKERQEPFVLEAYLLERGCRRKSRNSLEGNSGKIPKKSVGSDQKKAKKCISQPYKVLRAMYKKVHAINNLLRISSGEGQNGKLGFTQTVRNRQECSEIQERDSGSEEVSISLRRDYISSASESLHSLKPVDKRENEEAATRRNIHQECIEEWKQHSPVSVLEDIFSHSATQESSRTRQEEHSSRIRFANHMKITEEKILSASLSKLLLNSRTENPSCSSEIQEPEETVGSVSSTFLRSKRVLQQKKQLLFDFVKEATEKHQRENCGIHLLGFEGIGKIIAEKIKVWGNQTGDETNTSKLLELDLVHSKHEWYGLGTIKKEFALEIGDSIVEDVKAEIVLELSSLTE